MYELWCLWVLSFLYPDYWLCVEQTGGLSNRQKEHKKAMPLAAKRAKAARSRQEKKKQQRRSGKQFLGKKAWKWCWGSSPSHHNYTPILLLMYGKPRVGLLFYAECHADGYLSNISIFLIIQSCYIRFLFGYVVPVFSLRMKSNLFC